MYIYPPQYGGNNNQRFPEFGRVELEIPRTSAAAV
jgi:hypothetical protein